ncbi:MAG: hypothetical protein ACLSDQ_06950 [Adlercreutzia equolifaciens]
MPGDVTEDVVESVATSDPRAGEVCQGNGLSAGFPVFFGIKKKFKGIVYKRRLALTLPAALAFVSGLPMSRPAPAGATRSCAGRRRAFAGYAPDRPRAGGGHGSPAAARAVYGYHLRSCGLGLRAAASAEDSEGPKDPAGEDDEGPKDPPREDGSLFDPELRITFDDRLSISTAVASVRLGAPSSRQKSPSWRSRAPALIRRGS